MNIIFRVDASEIIGHGHVMRCLTLADRLSELGGKCTFICREHPNHLGDKISASGYSIVLLPFNPHMSISRENYNSWTGESISTDAEQTVNVIENMSVDWLVVDHYGINKDWESTLWPSVKNLMVIDDLANKAHKCNLLLDQTLGRSFDAYKKLVPDDCIVLSGTTYALLRSEFAKLRPTSLIRRHRNPCKRILVSLGGSDPEHLTLKVLKHLDSSPYASSVDIDAVVGSNTENLAQIEDFSKSSQINILTHFATKDIGQLMQNADIAIGASGGSSWERACLGLPTILFRTADNQSTAFDVMSETKSAICIDTVQDLSRGIATVLEQAKALTLRSASISDGQGANRVVDAMCGNDTSLPYSLTPACSSDKMFVEQLLGDAEIPFSSSEKIFSTDVACLIIQKQHYRRGCIIFPIESDHDRFYVSVTEDQDSIESELFAFARIDELYGHASNYEIVSGLSVKDIGATQDSSTLKLMRRQG